MTANKSLKEKTLVVIGAGNIGRILFDRLQNAGLPAGQIYAYDTDAGRLQAAQADFGAQPISLTDPVVQAADAILVAASPKATGDILRQLGSRLTAGQVVISFAAINPLEKLQALLPPGVELARVMPNAPSLVGTGMNPVAYSQAVTPGGRTLVEAILAALGDSIEVADEQMNWCVGLTGAAMRTVLPMLEGMTQAGIEAGLTASDARRVAAQVVLGTAALVLHTNLSFEQLKALTPMQTVDEAQLARLFAEAARGAKEKMDKSQAALWAGTTQSPSSKP